jgi:hypothetical protein
MNLATLLALLEGFPSHEHMKVIRPYRVRGMLSEDVAQEAEKAVRK